MNEYPKEIIEGVSPLIFAVDAVLAPNSHEDESDELPFAIQGQRSTAFETFYNYMESRKESAIQQSDSQSRTVSTENVQSKSPLLSSDPWAVFRKKYKETSSDTFLQHALVVPVSHRHAFPPSKDPDGTHNHASKLNSALYAMKRTSASMNPSSILMKDPIQGILAEGWIEKHSHALPSTIILVTYIDLNSSTLYEQARLEQHLISTLDSLSESCAKKRDVPILIAVLLKQRGTVATPKEMTVDAERMNSIRASCRMNHAQVIPIHCHDEKSTTIYSDVDYLRVQKAVQDSSMLYYLTQVRRCKRKYASLHHDQIPDLLPFAIRYCIKIAVFYEFQAHVDDERGGKSIKYWNAAYNYVQHYYSNLQGKYRTKDTALSNANDATTIEDSKPVDHMSSLLTSMSSPSTDQGEINEEETKVEIANDQIKEHLANMTVEEDTHNEGNVYPLPPASASSKPSNSIDVALAEGSSLDEKLENDFENQKTFVTEKIKMDAKELDALSLPTIAPKSEDDENLLMCHSEDMIYQCRSVADWVNMKILLNAYVSATKRVDDIESSQKDFSHIVNQMRTHSAVFMRKLKEKKGSDRNYPTWYFMKFVARQRLVVAQFLEHHSPPERSFLLNNVEIMSYCNKCNHYISAGDAYVRYESSLNDAKNASSEVNHVSNSDERQRYVGGLGSHELESILKDECKHDHIATALDCYSRALRLSRKDAETQNYVLHARIMYSMAKLCIRNEKYETAIRNLDSVHHLVQSFPLLRVAFHRLLSKCFARIEDGEKMFKKLSFQVLMDSRVNKYLSAAELSTLQAMLFAEDSEVVQEWPMHEEEGKPIYFSLTFQDRTYCTEGDKVPCTLHLCSTLPFTIVSSKIQVHTNLGLVQIHPNDQEIQIFLEPYTTKRIKCVLSIPHGCLKMADPSLLENQSYQGEKPTTFGPTAVGGGVLCQKHENEKFSGGLCVACLDLTLNLTISSTAKNMKNLILKLQNHHRGSFSIMEKKQMNQVTREEDNFLVSSWNRPNLFPISLGPRCLRVINTQADLQIVDLTSEATDGKLLEGTVNRMLLRVKTGKLERCADVKMRVDCKSFLRVRDSDSLDESYTTSFEVDRLPLIVKLSKLDEKSDFILPGWTPACDIESSSANGEWTEVSDFIGNSTEIYTFFDLFRPLSSCGTAEESTCYTEFTVTISYKKINAIDDDKGGLVEHQYQGTVLWVDPINVNVDILPRNDVSTPSGIRHPTNMLMSDVKSIDKYALVNGRDVAIRCKMSAPDIKQEMGVEIHEVSFFKDSSSSCKFELIETNDKDIHNNILYLQKDGDMSNCLTNGRNLQIGYLVKPSMILKDDKSPRVASIPLGSIRIRFSPLGIKNESYPVIRSKVDLFNSYYGPLPIKNIPPFHQNGPTCYIEETAFEVGVETVPVIPKVGVPFEICYNIRNKTALQQELRVSMNENEGSSSGMLLSGYINVDLVLGPNENRILRYSLLATKVGKLSPPLLNVSSVRYNTWVIRGSNQSGIYIIP